MIDNPIQKVVYDECTTKSFFIKCMNCGKIKYEKLVPTYAWLDIIYIDLTLFV